MIEMTLPQSQQLMLPERSFGATARSVAAHALLAATMMLVQMLVFVPAVLLHCGLRNGRKGAWAALGGAAGLAAVVLAATVPASAGVDGMMSWAELAGVILAIGLPTVLVLPLVERGESFGRVVMLLIGGTALGLVATEGASRAIASFSPYTVQVQAEVEAGKRIVAMYKSGGVPSDALRTMEWFVTYWSSQLVPAGLLIGAVLVFLVSLLMIGRLRAWREHVAAHCDGAVVTAYLFRRFSLPDWLLFGFVFGGITPLATGLLQTAAANVLTLVIFLYILQGLAIFRFLLGALGAGVAATIFGWGLLVLLTLMGVGPLLLGVAGLFDSFFDFRHFKKRKDDSHEGHSD